MAGKINLPGNFKISNKETLNFTVYCSNNRAFSPTNTGHCSITSYHKNKYIKQHGVLSLKYEIPIQKDGTFTIPKIYARHLSWNMFSSSPKISISSVTLSSKNIMGHIDSKTKKDFINNINNFKIIKLINFPKISTDIQILNKGRNVIKEHKKGTYIVSNNGYISIDKTIINGSIKNNYVTFNNSNYLFIHKKKDIFDIKAGFKKTFIKYSNKNFPNGMLNEFVVSKSSIQKLNGHELDINNAFPIKYPKEVKFYKTHEIKYIKLK
jgi:hypothetical protein